MTASYVAREDGARIAWESDGADDAPAVLLIMGLAYPAAMWFRLVPALAERFRVIRIDNRGAGLTGDVPGAPYTVETMAADCLAVLDEAGAAAAHVIGISMGGLMAQELAVAAPERVRSLCLMATHPGIAHAVIDPDTLALVTTGRAQMTPQEAAEASIPFNYAPATPRERIEEDWAVRFPLACSPEGYLAQVQGTFPWTRYDDLPGITTPTLVVHAELDRLVLPDNGRILAERIPGAELVTVPDANHVMMTDEPEQVTKILLGWLDRNS
ncbi:MAG: alpha/beta fold hydrolase [Frankiaceae bacterium]|nr:alpha/beta fold hydrolase [Frankiaceae bacterium]